ncbi:unnamed protein product [Acanthoscelides obtectus]|uniref:Uncharacterized protein n=1 Tax=Acanthoscelides obtectus TaxID=200917 RepID=A0A9P0LJA3_ACAOB|nr:unnamed protein product [Acanthoscelides obtectus]CAK1653546.1 hypothetical protein AOBTE_LOCUS18285 [Acanthoscelides obtectus]
MLECRTRIFFLVVFRYRYLNFEVTIKVVSRCNIAACSSKLNVAWKFVDCGVFFMAIASLDSWKQCCQIRFISHWGSRRSNRELVLKIDTNKKQVSLELRFMLIHK